MKKNKLGRYLIYAFGEIILVVVGILIALQVNNLNEERKAQTRRDNYYQNILDSFADDIEKIDRMVNYFKEVEKNLNEFRKNVQQAKSFEEASTFIPDVNIFTRDVDLDKATWETLIASGDVNLLDDQIREPLQKLWASYDDHQEAIYANSEHYWDIVKKRVSQKHQNQSF